MKKIISTVLVITMIFGICVTTSGCGSDKSKYEEALVAIDNEEWDSAIELLSNIDYENSKDLLEMCTKEKGMHENADYEYLDTLATDIKQRLANSENAKSLSSLVDTEIGMLEPFTSREFYDTDLKQLATNYLDGVKRQRDALSKKYADLQIEWQKGAVERYKALVELTDNYGFLKDDGEYMGNYYYKIAENENLLQSYEAINNDLNSQMGNDLDFNTQFVNNYTQRVTYVNNTEYAFSLTLYVDHYNDNNVNVDTTTEYYRDIKPGQTAYLDFYVPEGATWCYFYWEIEV